MAFGDLRTAVPLGRRWLCRVPREASIASLSRSLPLTRTWPTLGVPMERTHTSGDVLAEFGLQHPHCQQGLALIRHGTTGIALRHQTVTIKCFSAPSRHI